MNIFIGTSFGFIKGVIFDKATGITVEYTPHLRYAQTFKAGGARAFMAKYDIVGFLYNPYAQEPVRNMYEVKRDTSFRWDDENNDIVKEWTVRKAIMISESDVNWLNSKKLEGRDLLSFEEAQQKAIDLNLAMLEELQVKLNNQIVERDTIKLEE